MKKLFALMILVAFSLTFLPAFSMSLYAEGYKRGFNKSNLHTAGSIRPMHIFITRSNMPRIRR